MPELPWWATTTIYQVYPRSFGDTNGDGIGDLSGIVEKLDYITSLGVGTVWVSPFFASPQRDFGYDVSDYCDVAPEYGTLADAQRLIDECHARGLRVMFDLVLNHTSDEHPWFVESASSRDNPKADWYLWHSGGGPKKPPNNWRAALEVTSAWRWHEGRQQWFLGTFLECQPDLNYRNPDVKTAVFDAVRFWLDRGVDGFRLDIFGFIMKDPKLTPNPIRPRIGGATVAEFWRRDHTMNTDDNITLAKELRSVCDEYDGERVLLGEVFGSPEMLRRYQGDDDGLHLTFLFDFLVYRYKEKFFRARLSSYEQSFPSPRQPTYVLENHDRSRTINRVGGDERKARVLLTLQLTARGVPTLYMGQELGMSNTYIPLRDALDPIPHTYFSWVPEWLSKRLPERINRDEVRTPMQWDASPNAGFCMPDVVPWLPVNNNASSCNVENQDADDASLLNFTRRILRLRAAEPALHQGAFEFVDGAADGLLVFDRTHEDSRLRIALNFTDERMRLRIPASADLLLTTGLPGSAGHPPELSLPPHSAVVLRLESIS